MENTPQPPPSNPPPASQNIDPRSVLTRMTSSTAVVFASVILLIVGGLVALGKVPYSEFVSLAKYLGVTFVGGRSLEGGLAALLAPKRAS